ncbi:MAG: sigma-70 family RNA polymerase sigma factor [Acidobacteria bacterium]|nr:sigma-70 family RNA polymerase sigma factor [Acidobacteriota bacterium]
MRESGDHTIDALVHRLPAEFGARIYYLALRELRSPTLAEDVRNETLLRAIRALREKGIRNVEAMPGYIAGVARNVIREQIRRRVASTDLSDVDVAAAEPEITVDHTDRRALMLTLKRLSERERKIIRYIFYDELPKGEIAQRLGIPEERVRLVKSRALQSFREIYAGITAIRREMK